MTGRPRPGPSARGIERLLPPDDPELGKHFSLFRYSVFRLETLQTYEGSGEDEEIAAFGRGESEPPPDRAEDRWAAMLRANSAAGRTQQRVHVITEPISDYLAYELIWEYGSGSALARHLSWQQTRSPSSYLALLSRLVPCDERSPEAVPG